VGRGLVCMLLVVRRLRGHGRVVGCHDGWDGGAVAARERSCRRRQMSWFVESSTKGEDAITIRVSTRRCSYRSRAMMDVRVGVGSGRCRDRRRTA
jgi:hypothetical protein